jgi:signal transduction histidine kinase
VILVIAAVVPLVYLAWQASIRRQRLSLALLRTEALVAAQRYGTRSMNELYNGGTIIIRPLSSGRLPQSLENLPAPAVMFSAADKAVACRCAPVLRPAYAFRIDLATGRTRVDGAAPATDWLVPAVRQRVGQLAGGWDVALLGHLEPKSGRLVFITPMTSNQWDEPEHRHQAIHDSLATVMYGFAVDTEVVNRSVFRPLVSQMARLVGVANIPNDSALALRVTDEAGQLVFRTGGRIDEERASRFRLGDIWGGFVVTASIRAVAADQLLAAAVPTSPMPLLIALLGIALLLVSAALVLLWRTVDLARLRTDFTSSVSHELRTPLTQILLYAETLEMDRDESPEDRRRSIGIVTREARRLMHLVENVLRLSRAERGTVEVQPRAQPLAPILEEIIDGFEPIARARSVTVELRVTAPLFAFVDDNALRRIVLNYLDNAVRYGPTGQTVTVSAEPRGGRTRVSVEDEGPGIVPADRERIWKAFTRAVHASQASDSSCGIGLAVVRDLVRAHDGHWGVEPGLRGSRFFAEFRTASGM